MSVKLYSNLVIFRHQNTYELYTPDHLHSQRWSLLLCHILENKFQCFDTTLTCQLSVWSVSYSEQVVGLPLLEVWKQLVFQQQPNVQLQCVFPYFPYRARLAVPPASSLFAKLILFNDVFHNELSCVQFLESASDFLELPDENFIYLLASSCHI